MIPETSDKKKDLSSLPSVDELLKSPEGIGWLSDFPRRTVLNAIRDIIASKRRDLLKKSPCDISRDAIISEINSLISRNSAFSLRNVINATGIVLHTNLGRAVMSEKALRNVVAVGSGFSNLEYDLETGKRGKRHTHTERLLKEITGAEDAFIVNNNAAAVLLCLNTLAKDKEVVVSRGELVEIGGSFRVPDVMKASGAALREVGTTNKTHLHDYTDALSENTGMLLKVHQSNYKIIGFTKDVSIAELVETGGRHGIPVMYDLGSGCLLDLRAYGIHSEPAVSEIIKSGVDIVTFSGDKLLGGPQGGIIAGKKIYLEKIRKNPLARALRVDRLTIAAFEAVLMEYMDEKNAVTAIPVLNMLFQSPEEIKSRAMRLASRLKKAIRTEKFEVTGDSSKAGGGSLPELDFPTFSVSIRPSQVRVNELEERLRRSSPPIIARIREDALVLDARTIGDHEIDAVVKGLAASLMAQ